MAEKAVVYKYLNIIFLNNFKKLKEKVDNGDKSSEQDEKEEI
jgi:hypothetical protein